VIENGERERVAHHAENQVGSNILKLEFCKFGTELSGPYMI
jgi:hypothetical protein